MQLSLPSRRDEPRPPTARRRVMHAGAAAVLIAAGALLGAVLSSAVPLLLIVLVFVFLAWSCYQGIAASGAAAIVTVLFVFTISQPLAALSGWPLAISNSILAIVVACIAAGIVIASDPRARRMDPAAVELLAASLLVPIMAVVVACITVVRTEGTRIAWSMGNDSVWNTMSARFIVTDGGLAPWSHPNPSPLANEFMAMLMAPGRSAAPASSLMEHDIAREMQGLIIMTIVASILASLLVGSAVDPVRRVMRFVIAIGAGLLPWTWFVSGLAFEMGFYNVLLGTVVLFALWILWLTLRRQPNLAFLLLMLTSTVVLAVWAPLVVLPLVMALWTVVRGLASAWRADRSVFVFAFIGTLPFVIYAVAITIPDFRRDGSALSDDGAMVSLQPAGFLAGLLALCVGALLTIQTEHGHRRIVGIALVLTSVVFGVGYLVAQRADSQAPWGYYAAKFGWFVLILGALVAMHAVAERLSAIDVPIRSTAAIIAVMIAPGAIMLQVPPNGFGPASFVPAMSIVRGVEPSAYDTVAVELFMRSDPSEKVLFARYFDDSSAEVFVNGWLLQQSAAASTDPIRAFGYVFDTASVDQLCRVVEIWGSPVVIATRDHALESEFAEACPTGGAVIEAH